MVGHESLTAFEREIARALELIPAADNHAWLRNILGNNVFLLCVNIGRCKGVDITSVFPLIFASVTALVGHDVVLQVNQQSGHEIRLVLWNILLIFSGCGKSPVVDFITAAIEYVDRKVRKRMLAKLARQHEHARQQLDDGDEDADRNDDARDNPQRQQVSAAEQRAADAARNKQAAVHARQMEWAGEFTLLDDSVTMEATHLKLHYQQMDVGTAMKINMNEEALSVMLGHNSYKWYGGCDRQDQMKLHDGSKFARYFHCCRGKICDDAHPVYYYSCFSAV